MKKVHDMECYKVGGKKDCPLKGNGSNPKRFAACYETLESMPTQHTWYEEEMKKFDEQFYYLEGVGEVNVVTEDIKDWIQAHDRRLLERVEKIYQDRIQGIASWQTSSQSYQGLSEAIKILAILKDELK